ncbi:MAG: LysR family transcriptional regulator [Thomasclavelia ramosa]
MYNPQLETFIKVVDRGSFSKAAEDLFISPSAVIKQINILETNLGLKLLKRTHQRGIFDTSRSIFIQGCQIFN